MIAHSSTRQRCHMHKTLFLVYLSQWVNVSHLPWHWYSVTIRQQKRDGTACCNLNYYNGCTTYMCIAPCLLNYIPMAFQSILCKLNCVLAKFLVRMVKMTKVLLTILWWLCSLQLLRSWLPSIFLPVLFSIHFPAFQFPTEHCRHTQLQHMFPTLP